MELLRNIFEKLPEEEFFFYRIVCRQWRKIIPRNRTPFGSLITYYSTKGKTSSVNLLRHLFKYHRLSFLAYDNPSDDTKLFKIDTLWSGNKEVALWALSEFQKLPYRTRDYYALVSGTAKGGHVDILDSIVSLGLMQDYLTTYVCAHAAHTGQLEVLKWARKRNYAWDAKLTLNTAALNGHFEFFKWALENGCAPNDETCSFAARRNQIEVLEWAIDHGCYQGPRTWATAARAGSLKALKWAKEKGFPWNFRICENAAEGGHLEVLKWARENGSSWNEETCKIAAYEGHLELLKWARENGCPWNSDTCRAAAQRGDLEIVKWVRANGCPWDRSCASAAAEYGRLDVLKWLLENGCEVYDDFYEGAASNGHLNILKWVYDAGYEMWSLMEEPDSYKEEIRSWIEETIITNKRVKRTE